MTVREVIEKLGQFPGDMQVVVDDYIDCDIYEQRGHICIDAVEYDD